MKKLFCILTALSLLIAGAVPASAVVNGIFLGSDKNGVNILNDRLRPGEEYWFPLLVAVETAPPIPITAEDLERNKLEARVVTGGKAIASVNVEAKDGVAYLCIVPGGKGTVQELIATLRINYRSRDTGENVTVTPSLRVGYDPMPEGSEDTLEPGEFLAIDNLTPIVNGKQWNALAELNEYRDLTLFGNGWRFTVNTTGMVKSNMVTDHHPVMELVKQYPQHQMHFIGFPGAPDFDLPGKLYLDVSELADEYDEDFYLYRCAYGKAYPLKFDYDKDAAEISFRPSQLSTYLITDRKLNSIGSGSSSTDSSSTNDPPQVNPNTGEGGSFPAAVVAIMSLAGLGILAVSRRR